MRKVKFEIYVKGEWIKGEGLFHTWGISYEEFESGPANYSIAIVEDSSGVVHEVLPSKLVFVTE